MNNTTNAALIIHNSNQIQQMQRKQEEIECKQLLNVYDPALTTIAEMQDYAGCVNLLYPKETFVMPPFMILLLMTMCIVGTGIGIKKGYDFEDRIMLGFIGLLSGALIWLVLILFILGIAYVID